ncbi:hypothetical protein [uncultured Chryseobacterium sp.]|uniref:hypothetical protein n=1 Tax=uncultured Chryseobacterium sp. TaxID=259322 RepID=UPI00260BDE52|nr:hypothetical protein [uncultured Chryseobacterium sp.]
MRLIYCILALFFVLNLSAHDFPTLKRDVEKKLEYSDYKAVVKLVNSHEIPYTESQDTDLQILKIDALINLNLSEKICNGRNFYFGFHLGLPAKIFWNETESQWQFTMKSYGKELLLFYSVDNYSQNPPSSSDGLWRDNNIKCSMKKLCGNSAENEITQNYFLN